VLDPAAERDCGAKVRQHNRLRENPHDAAVGADRSAVDKHVNRIACFTVKTAVILPEHLSDGRCAGEHI
jgi:hypothetical protein